MAQFFDCKGRHWKLGLTVGALADVRKQAGLDLAKVLRSEADLLALLFDNPAGLVSVLWVLCESQAKDLGVSPEEFAHGFDGPALEQATEGLLGAIADFFPRSSVAKVLRGQLTERLQQMDRAVIAKLTQGQSATSNISVGDSPGSAGSTPAP